MTAWAETNAGAGAPHGAFASVVPAWSTLRHRVAVWKEKERGRAALWAPVGLGAGAACYFSLPVEPPLWFAICALAVSFAFALSLRSNLAAVGAACVAAGFLVADIRTEAVRAPVLGDKLSPRTIEGRLVSVEEAPGQRRLVIEPSSIDGVGEAETPRRVRVNWRGAAFDVLPGDWIRLRAGLAPPPSPEAPGAFDVARLLYFQRIGAVGYAVTPPERVGPASASASARIERARLAIARRITEAAPGPAGAIVAAVVTGKREAIPPHAERTLQDSGLAHLLAISGLHMGLATGLIFFGFRLVLASIEPITLRYPIKKWAAAAGLVAGFCYLLLSGGGWSARRAFIMTAIVFIAILFDRRALSLRNVAVAATIILLLTPEAVTHPGFQMSFAAVTALIAGYEWAAQRDRAMAPLSWGARLRRYVVGIAATDTISAIATAPFGAYHFNQSANFGLAANLVSIPVMAFWVMPAAIIGLVLTPLGLDGWAWRAAAAGVDIFLTLGETVADLPGAVIMTRQWPPLALGVLTVGGLWFCLQSASWRWAGLASVPAAAALIAFAPAPDVFVSASGANAGAVVFTEEGRSIAMFAPRRNRFSMRVWMEQVGVDPYRRDGVAMSASGRCDPSGCVLRQGGRLISLIEDPMALAADCERADLVIAFFPASAPARDACAARLIDRRAVWSDGAHAAWVSAGGNIRVKSVAEYRGQRPWSAPAHGR